MTDKKGYYALARRDLERGGESVAIVTDLPVTLSEITRIAEERDRLELAGNPHSDIRFFPVPLSPEDLAELGIRPPWHARIVPRHIVAGIGFLLAGAIYVAIWFLV